MNEQIEKFLKENMLPENFDDAINFIEQGFCHNGQITLSSLFVFAKEQGVDFEKVLFRCMKEFGESWGLQHPSFRGDLDATGKIGTSNRANLIQIYSDLGMKFPNI